MYSCVLEWEKAWWERGQIEISKLHQAHEILQTNLNKTLAERELAATKLKLQ